MYIILKGRWTIQCAKSETNSLILILWLMPEKFIFEYCLSYNRKVVFSLDSRARLRWEESERERLRESGWNKKNGAKILNFILSIRRKTRGVVAERKFKEEWRNWKSCEIFHFSRCCHWRSLSFVLYFFLLVEGRLGV